MFESNYEFMVFIKLIISILAGFVVGYFRRGGPAGIRTFILICVGCTLFTVVSIDPGFGSATDPSRVISAIVTGIGFLGVGVIWKCEGRLTGLTTAATIWVTAAIGIHVGLGEWFVAAISTIATAFVLMSKTFTRKIPPPKAKKK